MKKHKILTIIFIMALAVANVHAMDIGAMRPSDKQYSAEVFYESLKRDIVQDFAYTSDTFDGEQEEKRIIARFKFFPERTWCLSLDAGITEADGSEGYVPMFGLGGHIVVYDDNSFFASVFGKATYVTEIEYKSDYIDAGQDYYLTWVDYYWGERTETYWEYGIGAQFGRDWTTKAGSRITGYAGILASFINSDGEEKDWYYGAARGHVTGNLYEDADYDEESGVDFKEDSPVALFAGLEASLPNSDFGLRAEGRFVGQTSFTIGVFKGF
jgi:hypothetical protein